MPKIVKPTPKSSKPDPASKIVEAALGGILDEVTEEESDGTPIAEEEKLEFIQYDKPDGFAAELTYVDPPLAKEILAGSEYNRSLSLGTVRKYAKDMRKGEWRFNGQPIILNGSIPNATLLNGVHRLNAIIEGNVGLWLLFVKGVHVEAIRTMDTGRPRTFAQMLEIDGENAYNVLAPMTAYVESIRSFGNWQGHNYSTITLYARLNDEPNMREIATNYQRRMPGKLRQGMLAACEYLFAEKDADAASRFCEAIISGENLEKEDPAYVLREWLNHSDPDGQKANVIGNALVEHWNRFRRGEKMKRIASPKNCPVIE